MHVGVFHDAIRRGIANPFTSGQRLLKSQCPFAFEISTLKSFGILPNFSSLFELYFSAVSLIYRGWLLRRKRVVSSWRPFDQGLLITYATFSLFLFPSNPDIGEDTAIHNVVLGTSAPKNFALVWPVLRLQSVQILEQLPMPVRRTNRTEKVVSATSRAPEGGLEKELCVRLSEYFVHLWE